MCQVDQPPPRAHRDRQRLLRQQVLAGIQGCLAHLVVQREGREVVDRIDLAVGDQLAVIGIDRRLDIVLKIAQVGVRRGQRVARGRVEHRRAWRRALAAAPEHQRILFLTGAQRGDAEIIDPALAQSLVPLQMRVQDAAAADDTYSNHMPSTSSEF